MFVAHGKGVCGVRGTFLPSWLRNSFSISCSSLWRLRVSESQAEWPHISRYCDTIAAISHIARYLSRSESEKGVLDFPNLSFSSFLAY